jgi:hypothetical protein
VAARRQRSSAWRAAGLPRYLSFYNTERQNAALDFTTPAERLAARL